MRTFLNTLAALSPFLLLLLAGLGRLYMHDRDRLRDAERQVSQLKYQAYIGLLDIFFGMMKTIRSGEELVESQLVERMIDANKELMLYASDDVLRRYLNFLQTSREGTVDLDQFGELIVAIRRDMGNADTDITSDDVLRQIITDYDAAKARGELRRQIDR